jgi:hypothetical protein
VKKQNVRLKPKPIMSARSKPKQSPHSQQQERQNAAPWSRFRTSSGDNVMKKRRLPNDRKVHWQRR